MTDYFVVVDIHVSELSGIPVAPAVYLPVQYDPEPQTPVYVDKQEVFEAVLVVEMEFSEGHCPGIVLDDYSQSRLFAQGLGEESPGNFQGGRFSNIVRFRLERQAQQSNGSAIRKTIRDFFCGPLFLIFIGTDHTLHNGHGGTVLYAGIGDCLGVLWEAAAAVAGTGMQKLGTPPAHRDWRSR